MMIAARESFAAAARKRLPYDAEVRYLQSSGTQYFDTATQAADDVGYEMSVVDVSSFPTINMTTLFAGVFGSSNRYGAGLTSSASSTRFSLFGWWNSAMPTATFNVSVLSNSVIGVNFANSRHVRIGSVYDQSITQTYNPSGTVIRILNAKRMATGANSFANCCICKLSRFRVSRGSSVVADYVPVRVGTTGELYDRITGTFATRVGTFTVGPDKTA